MKKLFLFITVFISFFATANADVYVVHNAETDEVLSVSPKDDAVLPEGFEKTILIGGLENYPMEYQAKDYKLKNRKFIVNVKKISDREKRKEDSKNEENEIQTVRNKAFLDAYESLKASGHNFKYVDESFFTNE